MIKHSALLVAGALALPLFALSPAGATTIADPSFEGAITFDGVPPGGETASWEGFSGAAGSSAAFTTTNPMSGLQSLELTIAGDDNSFAGAFTDVFGVLSGEAYIFAGFNAASPGGATLGVAGEIRIEWRDSVGDLEIGRTPNLVPSLTSAYEPFSLSATAPAGADSARLVYAIQTFGGEPDGGASSTGTVFVDDVSITGTFVPEPTTTLLGALGMLGLLVRRRR